MPRNYWLHRVSHEQEVARPLLKKGILTTGFGDVNDPVLWQDFDKEGENKAKFLKDWLQKKWENKSKSWVSMFKFTQMKVGDWVLVPGWGDFSIYEIVSDMHIMRYLLPESLNGLGDFKSVMNETGYIEVIKDKENHKRQVDLGAFREVKSVAENINRSDYADNALQMAMKFQATTNEISQHKMSILQSKELLDLKKPIKLRSIFYHEHLSRLLDIIRTQANDAKLERLIRFYFKRIGAGADIPAKKEKNKQGDVDILVIFRAIKTDIYVQAKHHRGLTGDWGVQQIKDYKESKNYDVDSHSQIAWVITTGDGFNEEAKIMAQENEIRLINGLEFAEMLLDVGLSGLDF